MFNIFLLYNGRQTKVRPVMFRLQIVITGYFDWRQVKHPTNVRETMYTRRDEREVCERGQAV